MPTGRASFTAVRLGRFAGLIALAAVVGPGLLAGLSDDDAPGITTYSILGADYGYQLLWVLLLSTVALVMFHEIGARLGVITGQGLIGLIRERYGVRWAAVSLLALLTANIGTTCAEFAGVAAAMELAGVPRLVSVPVAALGVSLLVLRGSFRRIEHLLLALSTVFVAYIISGLLAGPDWAAAVHGLLVPSIPASRGALLAATATVGTTLAPWGLAFIQSYAVDKRLKPEDLRYERIDVITGAVLTGVIGVFVVVACAATLHADGRSINDARDAAVALDPLAGSLAATLFGAGLLGASLLAASILPLSTAYSVSEAMGDEAALDDSFADAPVFYGTYGLIVIVSAAIVLVPSAPLIPILFLSQVLNAVLLLPLLAFVYWIARDPEVMGEHANGRVESAVVVIMIGLIALCVAALGILSIV
jgi:NRAMP (natural resistance-associated macrophage protein)-like metal ion transporter